MTFYRHLSFLFLILLPLSTQAGHRPMQYKIGGKQTECIYEHLVPNDVITFSVFVVEALQNGKPRATIFFDGPVANITSTFIHHSDDEIIKKNDDAKGKITLGRQIRRGIQNDWPKINGDHHPNGVKVRKLRVDWTHAGESEDAAMARDAILEKTHNEFRDHLLEVKANGGETDKPTPLQTTAQKSVHPYEERHDIEINGWYRLCVKGDFTPLIVEMDIRVANKMKGIDLGTGQVFTHERRAYFDEQAAIVDKDKGEDIKDEHFEKSKKILTYMHDVTSKIMLCQHDRSHRLRAHEADARRGEEDMAWSSKLKTLMFVVISGVQVYTVHKWLTGNSLLVK